ncbi:MAG: glycosyltransferase family 1 protein [bacterium]|nr:glycosyltransferase family 1 protein [bacterium]
MRIGIDCRTILNPGFGEQAGVGHYTYFLVRHLLRLDQANEYVLFFDDAVSDTAIGELVAGRPNTIIRRFPFHAYRRFLPFAYAHMMAASFIARERCDVFHAPGGLLPYQYKGASLITVHDLAILMHPEWFPENVLERYASTRILLPRAIRQASRIIVPSVATRSDLIKFFPDTERKAVVIPLGVEAPEAVSFGDGKIALEEEMATADIRAKFRLGPRYLLYVGTIEPRKNIAALIRAFRHLRESDDVFHNVTLAIAGAKGWKYADVEKEIAAANQEFSPAKPVRFFGYVSHGDKWLLLKHAEAFVFPSRYEGFGLPVLEAMSVGTPVITSNRSSLPEVVGEAGILVNPDHDEEIREAMKQMLEDDALRKRLGAQGEIRAKEFTWIKTAEYTLEAYKTVGE